MAIKLFSNTVEWIKKNKKEFIWLFIILVLGAFLRLYRISDYMTFLGDEGRDAIIVRNLLVKFDPILIGPRTSIGDMYMGPLYYYLIAPSLLLANFSPVGPSVLVALTGVATIYLLWLVIKEVLGVIPARIASFLYATAPVIITYSHSSWNPNVMPFFSLLTIYSLWKTWYGKKLHWMIVSVVSYAMVLNSHWLGLLMLPVIFMVVFFNLRYFLVNSKKYSYIKLAVLSTLIFFFLMSPLVIFDARHGWRNFSSMKKFFTERQTTVSARPWSGIKKLYPIFKDDYVTRIMTASNPTVGKYISVTISIFVASYIFFNFKSLLKILKSNELRKSHKEGAFFILIFTWIFCSFLGLSLYKQHIYDHYFGLIYPTGFILFTFFYKKIQDVLGSSGLIIASSLVLVVAVVNLTQTPIRYPPNKQMRRAIDAADIIKRESGDKKLNLAVIAERNYEDGYQYFLEKDGVNVSEIDPQIPQSVADQLFVVCEVDKPLCDPVNSPKAEVANFGWSKIVEGWAVQGATVYKLVHAK